jgi:hypothetical protein
MRMTEGEKMLTAKARFEFYKKRNKSKYRKEQARLKRQCSKEPAIETKKTPCPILAKLAIFLGILFLILLANLFN